MNNYNGINGTEDELIVKAINSNSCKELELLAWCKYQNVRRCVAKNRKTDKKTIEKLATDPVRNVSYWAQKNPLCPYTLKKESYDGDENKCVLCIKCESSYNKICKIC